MNPTFVPRNEYDFSDRQIVDAWLPQDDLAIHRFFVLDLANDVSDPQGVSKDPKTFLSKVLVSFPSECEACALERKSCFQVPGCFSQQAQRPPMELAHASPQQSRQ
ncbi:hypothetical protein D3C86_1744030 [compost metagenome]